MFSGMNNLENLNMHPSFYSSKYLNALATLGMDKKESSLEDIKSKFKSIFPEKDKNRERIIINPNKNPILNINLPNGIEKLNNREIEENLGKVVKSTNIKNDISVCLNQASSSELVALKVKSNFNK